MSGLSSVITTEVRELFGGGGSISILQFYLSILSFTRFFIPFPVLAPSSVPPPHGDHFDPACGGGWFRNGDACYRVHSDEVPYRLARQTCQNSDPNADLLWITSKEEERYIRSRLFLKKFWPFGYSAK